MLLLLRLHLQQPTVVHDCATIGSIFGLLLNFCSQPKKNVTSLISFKLLINHIKLYYLEFVRPWIRTSGKLY